MKGIDILDKILLDILVCPLTRTALRYDGNSNELISDEIGMAFPIQNGIPIMLIDESRKLATFKGHMKDQNLNVRI